MRFFDPDLVGQSLQRYAENLEKMSVFTLHTFCGEKPVEHKNCNAWGRVKCHCYSKKCWCRYSWGL